MILGDGLLKNSLSKTEKLLRDNPWVQSPLWSDVKNLLSQIDEGHAYFRRGSKVATKQLKHVEETHRRWVSSMINLDYFSNMYVVAGATEAINQWRMTDHRPWQYLKGDYQWPQIVSGTGKEVDIDDLLSDHVLYVSNPSCRDGNFLSPTDIEKIEKSGCPVILDCAYIGATAPQAVPVFSNTEQIFFSFSKGWGLIGQRAGLVYSRNPHATLCHMQRVECWNYQTPQIISMILQNFKVETMHSRGLYRQKEICLELGLKPSDTYFLATSEDPLFEKQRRISPHARLCLTPLWSSDELV